MPSSEEATLGLFPLGLVLLPGEHLPLHIFEERYKRLIGECRETGGPFGIVLYHEHSVAEHGCTAEVIEVLQEFQDGRLDIVVEGRDRFRLLELIAADENDEGAYLGARVEYYDDLASEAPERLVADAERLARRLLALTGVEPPGQPLHPVPPSFGIAGGIDLSVSLKQRLLEQRSEAERLELLVSVMSSLAPRLELRKEREEAIGGNGKGY